MIPGRHTMLDHQLHFRGFAHDTSINNSFAIQRNSFLWKKKFYIPTGRCNQAQGHSMLESLCKAPFQARFRYRDTLCRPRGR